MESIIKENEILKEKITTLEKELNETKEHLKKYTAPARSKTYYEQNKEKIIEKVKEYNTTYKYKPTPEQKKEWARRAYLKRKEKNQKEKEKE
jgi:hypothetical protein